MGGEDAMSFGLTASYSRSAREERGGEEGQATSLCPQRSNLDSGVGHWLCTVTTTAAEPSAAVYLLLVPAEHFLDQVRDHQRKE